MTDANDVVATYLKSALAAAPVSGHVSFGKLPDGFNNSQSIIEFSARGGDEGVYVETHEPSYQFKCYGGTSSWAECFTVYGALYDVLHNKNMLHVNGKGVILRSESEGYPQALEDPDENWPFVLAFFSVSVRPQ